MDFIASNADGKSATTYVDVYKRQILFSYLKNNWFKKSVQTISYFPYFLSWVVVSGIAYLFLAADGGILNQLIALFGGDAVQWYSEPQYWRAILTFTSIWKTVGYSTIVYLSLINI